MQCPTFCPHPPPHNHKKMDLNAKLFFIDTQWKILHIYGAQKFSVYDNEHPPANISPQLLTPHYKATKKGDRKPVPLGSSYYVSYYGN